MRGRLTDTEENRAAADFIRSRFERMGLKPAAPNGSYFQNYNLMTATLGDGGSNSLDLVMADGASRHLREGQEFFPQRFSASGAANGPVVFAGFGISAPHLQYDDYRGPGDAIKDKIVLVIDHEDDLVLDSVSRTAVVVVLQVRRADAESREDDRSICGAARAEALRKELLSLAQMPRCAVSHHEVQRVGTSIAERRR